MYIHKSELGLDIERLARAAEDDGALVDKCREARGRLETLQGSIREYVRDGHCIVEAFVLGMKMKHVPAFVVDYIYTFLVNEMLLPRDVGEVVEAISRGSGWCDVSKMKILQMSYYFTRYDGFDGDAALMLFRAVFRLVEDRNRQIQTTARPVVMHLVDAAFSRACTARKSVCVSDGEEEMRERRVQRSEELPHREGFGRSGLVDDGLAFLRFLLSQSGSRDVVSFAIEVVLMITQKEDLFEFDEFRRMYSDEVIEVLAKQIREGWSAQGRIYKILARLARRHSDMLGVQIQRLLDEMDRMYLLLDDDETRMFLEFFGDMDVGLFELYAAAIRRIFFRILEDVSLENAAANRVAIGCISRSLGSQMKMQGDASGKMHVSRRVFFDKFAGQLYTKLCNTRDVHPGVDVLLRTILDFYAVAGDRELLERFLQTAFRLGFSELACRFAIDSRRQMQESWGIVLEQGREHIKLVVEALSSFDAEELFFLTKAVGMLGEGSWTPRERTDFLQSVFTIVKPVVVEPPNVRILEIILTGILRDDSEHATKVFCSILVDYFGQMETLVPDVESVVFSRLHRLLAKDVEGNGVAVLDALLDMLRLNAPDRGWEAILQCVEDACVPLLHCSLFPVIRWIVGEFSNQIAEQHVETVISCLCRMSSGDTGLRAVFLFQDIGESLISRRIMAHAPGESPMPSAAWTRYLNALVEMSGDRRHVIRDPAIKYLFGFVDAELDVVRPCEWEFVSRSCLIPLFRSSRMLMGSSEADDVGTLVLMLRESIDVMTRAHYNEQLFGEFLDLMEHGMCSESCEVQNLCLEGMKALTRRASEIAKQIRGQSDDENGGRPGGKDQSDGGSNSDDGFLRSEGKEKHSGMDLREQVLKTYRLMLGTVAAEPMLVCDLLDLARTLSLREAECSSLVWALGRFVNSRDLQDRVLDLVEFLGAQRMMDDVLLEAYSSWMDVQDVRLTTLLMARTARILSGRQSERYPEMLLKLTELSGHPVFWESAVEAMMKSSENIAGRKSFVPFVEGSRTVLEESCRMLLQNGEDGGVMRRRERIVLEFLSFYHNTLLRLSVPVESQEIQPFDQISDEDIRHGYSVVFALSAMDGMQRENVSLKCYRILFHNPERVYDELLARTRHVLQNYNEIEAIYNGVCPRPRQKEMYVVLEGLCREESRRLMGDVRDVLVESLRSKDYRVIDYIRRCLVILVNEW